MTDGIRASLAVRWPAALGLVWLGLVGCAPSLRARPGDAEARVTHYADDNELSVTTYVARVEQPVAARSSVFVRGIADHVVITPRPLHAPHPDPGQPTGHRDADVVTSASSTAGGAAGSDKWRYEALVGGEHGFDVNRAPATVRGYARFSSEPDYTSFSTLARFSAEPPSRNTTVAAFGGFGIDRVDPLEPPPGQRHLWPATHHRVLFGGSVAQILSPRVLIQAGFGTTRQEGALSNPYRRAVVRTSLFPEQLPQERWRHTAFASLSAHLGLGAALHLRQGVYTDSWDVLGVVPEVMLAKELGARGLVTLRYRFVGQGSASFYEPVYSTIMPIMAGDMRLGTLREHAVAAGGRFTIIGAPGDYGTLAAFAEQELSSLRYERIGVTLLASTTTVGLSLLY